MMAVEFNKKYPVLIFIIFLITVIPQFNITAEFAQNEERDILLLNSYNQEMFWVKEILRGVKEVLPADEYNLRMHVENMDSKTFHNAEYFTAFRNMLKTKYAARTFSIIFCSDNNAYDFLREYRDELFPGVPVIFCGVANFSEEQVKGLDKFIGVAEKHSVSSTLEIIRRFHPATKEVFIVNDYLTTGRVWQLEMEITLEKNDPGVEIRYSENLPIKEQLEAIFSLGPDSVLLLGAYYSDKNGYFTTYEQMGELLAGASRVPVYCLLEFNITEGIIGGDVVSSYYQGKAMAEIGRDILNGADINTMPLISDGSNKIIFDYRELKRYSIDEKLLPDNSIILNKPFSLFETYKWQIYSLITIFTLMLFVIFVIGYGFIRSKRSEKKLHNLRTYLADIINSMPSALIGIDSELRITQWNIGSENLTGILRNAAIGKPLLTAFPYMKDEIENIEKAVSSQKIFTDIREYTTKENEIQNKGIIIYPLKTEGYEGAVIRVDDITEKIKMQKMMIQSEKMLSVGGLAAGMAHEINNPLAAMLQTMNVMSGRIGYKQSIKANEKAAETAGTSMEAIKKYIEIRGIPKMLNAIAESGRRISEITHNMLSFARKGDDSRSSHYITDLLDNSLELASADYDLKKQWDFKHIKIIKEYEDKLPMTACEGSMIQQVVLNILRNGSEAMHEAATEAPHFVIRAALDREKNMLAIEIEDNGPGMSDDIKNRVFEPFFTTKPVGIGTGLGLSVSYFIITETHNGEMTVESEQGCGTTFIIRLPCTDS